MIQVIFLLLACIAIGMRTTMRTPLFIGIHFTPVVEYRGRSVPMCAGSIRLIGK